MESFGLSFVNGKPETCVVRHMRSIVSSALKRRSRSGRRRGLSKRDQQS
jgi:hypothetical protein